MLAWLGSCRVSGRDAVVSDGGANHGNDGGKMLWGAVDEGTVGDDVVEGAGHGGGGGKSKLDVDTMLRGVDEDAVWGEDTFN